MKFSVIVPVYNVAPYLRACLDSVIAQTFVDFECICVDDGSTDGSRAIVDEYAAKDSRFKVIRQPNGGKGAARNAGLAVVRGEWFCFLDADDVLRPEMLQSFAAGVEAAPMADVCAVGSLKFDDGETIAWPSGNKAEWRVVDVRSEIPLDVFKLSVWSCAYRAKRFLDLRFGGLTIGEDRVYLIAALERAQSLVSGSVVTYGYRQHDGSAMRAAMTARKFLHELRHQMKIVEMITRSSKDYDREALRSIGLAVVERYAEDYAKLARKDRDRVWDEWLSGIQAMLACPWFGGTLRWRAALIAWSRSRLAIWLLGYWVNWLKLHGVNRRLKWNASRGGGRTRGAFRA